MKLHFYVRLCAVLATVVILIFSVSVQAAEAEVDLQSATAEGGASAPILIESATGTMGDKTMDGIKVTFEFRAKIAIFSQKCQSPRDC